jgi:hypothetical protein
LKRAGTVVWQQSFPTFSDYGVIAYNFEDPLVITPACDSTSHTYGLLAYNVRTARGIFVISILYLKHMQVSFAGAALAANVSEPEDPTILCQFNSVGTFYVDSSGLST